MLAAVLQARASSKRLPLKVLKPILGVPMLERQIERLKRVKSITHFILATSQDPSDDAIEALARRAGVGCYRGSLNDVLDRIYQAVKGKDTKDVVRLTGDCPLTDPALIDEVIQFHQAGGYDYSSNTLEPTYPDGLDVEIFRYRCLEEAWREATLASEREHVTPFIYKRPERYRLGNFRGPVDLSQLRWTVDQAEDFQFVTAVYEALYPKRPDFSADDVLNFLKTNEELSKANAQFIRNAGYLTQVAKEKGNS